MFKLMRVLVLAVSLWLPHGSQHIGSLSPATTCKLPRDLTSLVWHSELAERREAVNFIQKDSRVAIAALAASQLCLTQTTTRTHSCIYDSMNIKLDNFRGKHFS